MNIQTHIAALIVGALIAVVLMLTQCEPSVEFREHTTTSRTVDTAWAVTGVTATKTVTLREQTDKDKDTFGEAVPGAGCIGCVDSLGNETRDCRPAPFVAEDVTVFGLDTLRTAFAYPQAVFTFDLKRNTPTITIHDSTVVEREKVITRQAPIGLGLHAGYGLRADQTMDWTVSIGLNINILQLNL